MKDDKILIEAVKWYQNAREVDFYNDGGYRAKKALADYHAQPLQDDVVFDVSHNDIALPSEKKQPLAVSEQDIVYVPVSVEKELPELDDENARLSLTVIGFDDADAGHWCYYDYTTNTWEGDGFWENTKIVSWLKPVKLSSLKAPVLSDEDIAALAEEELFGEDPFYSVEIPISRKALDKSIFSQGYKAHT